MEPQPTAALETVFRLESPRVIAGVARLVRDVGIAEELTQDALVAALEQWPRDGVPDNPGAWLMATARRRAVDLIRRRETYARKLAEIGRELPASAPPPEEPADPEDIDDDLLRLVFTACHPVLSAEARIALTLRLLGGLTTPEIARACLVPEPTVAQRIVRAKRTLARKNVAFEVPYGPDREARLGSVLEVIYLIFNEGYAATAGDDWLRPALCEDALRLARVLSALMPKEPEVHGLAALLEFQSSRTAARTAPDGEPVLLKDQNRHRWNRLLIARGVTALGHAHATTGSAAPGPYALQAAIAACHATAHTYEETDWPRIAALYGLLAARAPSPVVELNRAVAVSMAEGPAPALALVDALAAEPALRDYHLLPSVRGDLLARLGRTAEAREEFERAASLTRNARERALLLHRAQEATG
ncbi:sigma-70 family RNA polymerase sigma factor [Streptomyces sp. KPB2]|uniref:RNA polymerase sigma factor n=1 Tax=Streptomyces TaxID=1883 RepID=UPI000F6ECB7B|nr:MULTISPECIES: sigma-70 family RNA polymerase sigma factor [Streptomyces]WSU01821.1 sigma-70 family RNA polymerase sigma factor [Streptomyces sp. NBC_01124]AZM76038.1 sigma-70 family RNA polymerase sigma factor [Streptomyces sp. KPB2]MBH5133398.1 sigma-70 family RNA polymerase sigma factor [Streptomyces sp. HB-N217]MDU0255727.1 sigma-70 family RNA polymerase sigma factor [Streptomyces sp. PU10]QKW61596.1 sigma-70 family RNA polymerase sigma factor [Streptomyces sp. NA03103]